MMDSNEFDWTYVQPPATKSNNKDRFLSDAPPADKTAGIKKYSRWPSFKLGKKKPSFKLGKRAENMMIRAVVLAGELAGDLIPEDVSEFTGGQQSLRCNGRKELPACNMDCECLC